MSDSKRYRMLLQCGTRVISFEYDNAQDLDDVFTCIGALRCRKQDLDLEEFMERISDVLSKTAEIIDGYGPPTDTV